MKAEPWQVPTLTPRLDSWMQSNDSATEAKCAKAYVELAPSGATPPEGNFLQVLFIQVPKPPKFEAVANQGDSVAPNLACVVHQLVVSWAKKTKEHHWMNAQLWRAKLLSHVQCQKDSKRPSPDHIWSHPIPCPNPNPNGTFTTCHVNACQISRCPEACILRHVLRHRICRKYEPQIIGTKHTQRHAKTEKQYPNQFQTDPMTYHASRHASIGIQIATPKLLESATDRGMKGEGWSRMPWIKRMLHQTKPNTRRPQSFLPSPHWP